LVVGIAGHPDVSANSPVSSPGVLDKPVIRRGDSPSNSQDTVVQLRGRAGRLVVDSAGVELEGGVAGINGDGGGALADGRLQAIFRTRLNIGEALFCGSRVGGRVLASSVLSSVGVGGLSVNTTIGNDVSHGLSHQTTIATLISLGIRAVNQVLLRQGDQLVGSQEVAALNGASGGEGPAGTALALILDASDSTLVSPVEGGGQINMKVLEGGGLVDIALRNTETSEHADKFIIGQITELVHSNSEATVSREVVDEVKILLVVLEANLELIVGIGLLLLVHPVNEGVLVLQSGEGQSQRGREEQSENSKNFEHFQRFFLGKFYVKR